MFAEMELTSLTSRSKITPMHGHERQMERIESYCMFCSLGCKLAIKTSKSGATTPDFCSDYPLTGGNLCPRGLYATELLNHNQRIVCPLVREGRTFQETSWDEGFHILISKIKELRNSYGPQSIGIIIDPNHTNEEIIAARELAKTIGTDNISCSFSPNDRELLGTTNITSNGSAKEIEDVDYYLIIGDLFVRHPVLAKKIIASKYKSRENSVVVIDPKRTNTAWHASIHLQNKPGSEIILLMGILKSFFNHYPEKGKDLGKKLESLPDEDIARATGINLEQLATVSRGFNNAEKGAIILCPGIKGVRDIGILSQLARLLTENYKGDKKYIPLFTYGNAVGAFKMSTGKNWLSLPHLISKISSGEIKLLLDFGEELLSSYPSPEIRQGLEQLEFFAVSSIFTSETETLAHLVLPCASWAEKSGTVNFFDGRRESLEPFLAPAGASRADLDIIAEISHQLGTSLNKSKIQQEAEAAKAGSLNIGRPVKGIEDLLKEALVKDKEFPYLLISCSATGHFADGSITKNMKWARETFPLLWVELNSDDAQHMEIKSGDEVIICSRKGQITLPVQITSRLQPGVVNVPSYSTEIRSIFSWEITPEGEFKTGPERVRISRKQE